MKKDKVRILIAGIGGASLGTEILKSLLLEGETYYIVGCDISPLAYGHYQSGFSKTYHVDVNHYTDSMIDICKKERIQLIIPGGERPLSLLSREKSAIDSLGIKLIANSDPVIENCSNKQKTFSLLKELGFEVPATLTTEKFQDLKNIAYPCVVKPATGTGGSDSVFLAGNYQEAQIYIEYLQLNGKIPIVQEYVSEEEGEFTVGVLSLPNGKVVGSVAMQRIFHTKLSVFAKTKHGLISSGYSQGLIDDFPLVCELAERIAAKINSRGPINIQGRVRNGILIPFEINPRFSASSYLRALAGFNEIHHYIQYLLGNTLPLPKVSKPGYYLRSLSEQYVPKDKVIN